MRTVALIPAFNAERTVAGVVDRIPDGVVDEVLILDDGSTDSTWDVLSGLAGVVPLRHDANRGYGAAQKSLYRAALERQAERTVILHSDGGHFPEEIPRLLAPLADGSADIVVGSRTRGILSQMRPLAGSRTLAAIARGPMPGYKFAANLALTRLQNLCYGTRYHAFHDGFRACNRAALERLPFERLTDWYLYDAEFLLAGHSGREQIAEVGVSSYYDPRAGSSAPAVRYGFRVLGHAGRYVLNGRRLSLQSERRGAARPSG